MTEAEKNQNLLAVFHYVVGGFHVLFGLFPLIHVAVGLGFVFAPGFFGEPGDVDKFPKFFGWFFAFMGMGFVILAQVFAGLILASGRFLKQRRRYRFSFVVACLLCLSFPFGSVLGIATIVILSSQEAKALYGRVGVDNPLQKVG